MFIPDVINTLLMGLIFMVVIVTIVRPFVLNMVGQAASRSDGQSCAEKYQCRFACFVDAFIAEGTA